MKRKKSRLNIILISGLGGILIFVWVFLYSTLSQYKETTLLSNSQTVISKKNSISATNPPENIFTDVSVKQNSTPTISIVQKTETPGPINQPTILDRSYRNNEFGFHFDYPSFLTLNDEIEKIRGENGEILTTIVISAIRTDPLIGIVIRSYEDPLKNEMFPNSFPPDETLLKILMVIDLSEFANRESDKNENAIKAASENSTVRKISDHSAVEYNVELNSLVFDNIYIRGALVITEKRDIGVYVFGSNETRVNDSVKHYMVDELWNSFIDSLMIDY